MLLEAADLTVKQGRNEILHQVNLTVHPGEFVTLLGPNGSGKTTLLRTLARLLSPVSGKMLIDGVPAESIRRKDFARMTAYLPQSPGTPAGLTVEELVSSGRFPYRRHLLPMTQEDRRIVDDTLIATGLMPFRKRRLDTLSGGERQKAWIAMTFAQTPELLILDEPTTYLDPACQMEILSLIRDFSRKKGKSVLMVLHDINMSLRVSDRIAVMKEGCIFADGTPEKTITSDLLQQLFGITSEFLRDSNGTIQIVPLFPPQNCRQA